MLYHMKLCRSVRLSLLLPIMAFGPAFLSATAAPTYYAGLVYSGNPYVAAQSGIFLMSVSQDRNFTGRMLIGHRGAGFWGRFDTNGAADIVITITIDNSCYECDPPIIDIETKKLWDVHLQLSPAGDTISGGLHFRHGGLPDGTLSGKRSSFNFNNQVQSPGQFTFVLSGSGDPADTNSPTGNGVGALYIDSFANVDLVGSLPDKSSISLGSVLCDDGTFPVFVSLYKGKGMLQGWIGLTNTATADLAGDVLWVKPEFAARGFYPAGFTNDVPVVGSRYIQTSPVLDWTNGVVTFQGGKLSAPFTNSILLNAKNKAVNLSDNKLALKIQSKLGRFNGWVREPSTQRRIPFIGVVLQKENGGFGYFPDAPLSGQAMLAPATP